MSHPFAHLAQRAKWLQADNPLRALTEVINRVEGGINLGQGVCDLDTPAALVAGAVESLSGGQDRQTYTHYSGLAELRELVRTKLLEFNGLNYGDDEVMIASGSSGAFYAAATVILEPGDEVILFEPFYSYHWTALCLMGAVPVSVPLEGAAFDLNSARLKEALTDRTRAIMINTPGNPSGKVFSKRELEEVADAIADTDVIVFTDEVYEYMCFDGAEHVSPAKVDGLANRSLTISSFSKTFSITGWRIGYLAGPSDMVELVGRAWDQMCVCAARPMQRGVAQALKGLPGSFYDDLQASYERKRDQFCAALEAGGFRFHRPQGAYYVLADYSDVLGDLPPYEAVLALIDKVGINGVPGDLFFANPDPVRSIRFQFAVDESVLDGACERLAGLKG